MARNRTPFQRQVSDRLHEEIGRRIKEARSEKDILQAGLADELGLSRATISKIERGKQRMTLDQLYLIAYRLAVPVENLLPDLAKVVRTSAVRTAADDPLPPEAEEQASRLAEDVREELQTYGAGPTAAEDSGDNSNDED